MRRALVAAGGRAVSPVERAAYRAAIVTLRVLATAWLVSLAAWWRVTHPER